MEAINLTEEQRLYLQHILDYWRQTNEWPTHQYLDKIFYRWRPDIDIEKIWKDLPRGLVRCVDRATLTIPAIYLLEKDAPEFSPFLKVLKLLVDSYILSDKLSEISSKRFLESNQWLDKWVYRVGLLLIIEPGIWQSFSGPDETGNWTCEPAWLIRRFRGVTTIEEYLEKRDPYSKTASIPSTPSASSIGTSITAKCTLHPDIHRKCWGLYTQGDYDNAILNATKAIEVAIRKKSNLPDNLVGVKLITQAFNSDKPIFNYSAVKAEQDGMRSLLCGIIQVYKNPQSHHFVGIQNQSECLGIMIIYSNLLYTIDSINVAQSAPA